LGPEPDVQLAEILLKPKSVVATKLSILTRVFAIDVTLYRLTPTLKIIDTTRVDPLRGSHDIQHNDIQHNN
jgi:hypothetical protein